MSRSLNRSNRHRQPAQPALQAKGSAGRRMRWIFPLLFLLILLLGTGFAGGTYAEAHAQQQAQTAPTDRIVGDQANRLPTDEVASYWSKLMEDYGGYFPEGRTPTFKEMMTPGKSGFSIKGVMLGLLKFLFHEIIVNGKLLATIVTLTVFSLILETFQSAFEKRTVSKIGYSIVSLVLIVLAVNSFKVAIGYAQSSIDSMVHFMIAVVPLLLTLLASTGNLTSVAVLHPVIVFMIQMTGTAITFIVFPLLFFSVVLHIVSSLSDKYKVTQLAKLMQKVGVSLLGVFVTLFMGVLSVQGMTGAVTDGVMIRTAKYMTGNFVPVVGKLFTDASDTVVGASLLVKNAVGLAGVVVIVFLCAFPAIKILTLALIYNLAAAVMQPLGDSPIVKCLGTIGKSMMYVFAALAAVGFMFFLAITIIITASNVSMMIR